MCVNPPTIVTIVWWWPSPLSHTVCYCNPDIPLDPTGCDIDKLIKQREQNKIRQAKYREKKKNLVLDSNTDHNSCPVKKRFTRAEHEKKEGMLEKS